MDVALRHEYNGVCIRQGLHNTRDVRQPGLFGGQPAGDDLVFTGHSGVRPHDQRLLDAFVPDAGYQRPEVIVVDQFKCVIAKVVQLRQADFLYVGLCGGLENGIPKIGGLR